ncbi:PA14 domain containing protein [uncultured Caudovirales phage]|uniref:PA14 domain containing protein n=1 Tax=uncultured Caudovirales phage TaxID=2100421 RepID=A0A6J5KWQ3_9CAUD|nr:PA14 domain containing protein [uncultured Caudovirales phage]
MKHLLVLSALGLALASCGQNGSNGIDGKNFIPAPTTPIVQDLVQEDIDSIISFKNTYRVETGNTPLGTGLMCQVFTFTSGDRIQASIAGHNTLAGLVSVGYFEYKGLFNQPDSSSSLGNNVLPQPFKGLYKNNYLLRCQGQIVIQESGYHKFEANTDDASVLYIDGSVTIDNDNAHGITSKSNMKLLERGVHSFRLDYAQGNGNQALVIKMDEASIDARLYYR